MKNNKHYILSIPCSGKTHFTKKHKNNYKGLQVVDFDKLRPHRDYRAFNKVDDSTVILGGIAGMNIKYDVDVVNYIAVIPTDKILTRNLKLRNRTTAWGKKENVFNAKKELINFVKKYNIVHFDTFEAALDYIIKLRNE